MNEVMGSSGTNSIFEVLLIACFLMLFWILEVVWRNDKKGLILIALLPPTIVYFIYKNWEETRGKCFFAAMLILVIILISAVTKYNFSLRIADIFQIIFLWPYYAVMQFIA